MVHVFEETYFSVSTFGVHSCLEGTRQLLERHLLLAGGVERRAVNKQKMYRISTFTERHSFYHSCFWLNCLYLYVLTSFNKWVHQQQNEINKIDLYNYSIFVSIILMSNTFFHKEKELFVFVYFSPSGR